MNKQKPSAADLQRKSSSAGGAPRDTPFPSSPPFWEVRAGLPIHPNNLRCLEIPRALLCLCLDIILLIRDYMPSASGLSLSLDLDVIYYLYHWASVGGNWVLLHHRSGEHFYAIINYLVTMGGY